MASQEYLNLLRRMEELHKYKANGYSGVGARDTWKNFRLAQAFGVSPLQGVLVRMSDKWSRLQSIWANPEVAGDETFEDTLMDLASYALIAICLKQESQINDPAAPYLDGDHLKHRLGIECENPDCPNKAPVA